MSAAHGLHNIQQLDSRLGRNEARLQEIEEKLQNNAELQVAQERLRAAEAELHTSEHSRRSMEAEAQVQQAKISRVEASLYGGSVRNPKELQELQADAASLKRNLAATEDRELQFMLHIDHARDGVKAAEEQLREIQLRLQAEQRVLIDERSALAVDQDNLQAQRRAAVSAVPAAMLASYEGLRLQRHGVGVAEILENACGACGTILTAALQQSARHATQLVHCPTCGRILFAG